ncbi:bolA-like protein 3 [Crassostrea angulata]|uniref:BolA-like protein 3 n=1 Tax=Magallana gigas TaxID=29159 RepID=A0A8W8K8H5_MAGGI|nr:bolA-like protein 3 [Crassostrea gigas]XP_052712904.1 bolA-like protein 3 [Crassostrea angulata]
MLRIFRSARLYLPAIARRGYCDANIDLTEGEKKIISVLKTKFPSATKVEAQDISGGCGAMYTVFVEAEEFRGQRTIKQHRMVNEALKEEIKDMHGLRITTGVPG